MNGSGYIHTEARAGRVWVAASNPSHVNPTWIGNTVFNAMAPIIVYRNPAGSNVKATVDQLLLFINNTPGGFVSARVLNDRIDRYVTLSGTLNSNGNAYPKTVLPTTVGGAALTSALEVYDELVDYEDTSFTNSITYNGASVNVTSSDQETDGGVIAASAGAFLDLQFKGAFILEPGMTAAVYAWAATTAPQGRFVTRWKEERFVS